MTPAPGSGDWLRAQVEAYAAVRERYDVAADLLREVLTTLCRTVAASAQVQARAKSVASFGEKALRSAAWIRDPVRDFTDLCGARVIVSTRDDVDAVVQLLRHTLPIDAGLGGDVGERLGRYAFGYRSVHLVLSLPTGVVAGLPVPGEVVGLRAELQVRTAAEHAWADFAHDRTYKGQVPLPREWERELSGLAASLESVDAAFVRLDRQLRDFAAHYPAYLSVEDITRELDDMSTLLALVPGETGLARRVAGLAKTLGRWEHIVEVLEPYADGGPPDLVRDLGTALCQLHAHDRQGSAFLRGRTLLRQSAEVEPTDADTWATLAGTYKGEDEQLSTELYENAYLAAPDDSYSLGNLLESPVLAASDTRLLRLLQPVLWAALRRCQQRADVGVDLPWSYLDQGRLHLLLEEDDLALDAYCAAVVLAAAAFPLATARRSLDRLERLLAGSSGQTRARDLLTLALFTRFGVEPDRLPAPGARWKAGPLTVAAVGSSAMDREGALAILAALHNGTTQVVCAGTTGRAANLPAELEAFPSLGPLLGTSEILQLYADVLRAVDTRADIAILAAGPVGLDSPAVRMAVALGFRVGAITRTPDGRVRATWPGSHYIAPLPLDVDTLRAFLPPGSTPASADGSM